MRSKVVVVDWIFYCESCSRIHRIELSEGCHRSKKKKCNARWTTKPIELVLWNFFRQGLNANIYCFLDITPPLFVIRAITLLELIISTDSNTQLHTARVISYSPLALADIYMHKTI